MKRNFLKVIFCLFISLVLIAFFQNCSPVKVLDSDAASSSENNNNDLSNPPSPNDDELDKTSDTESYQVKFLTRGVSKTLSGNANLNVRASELNQSMGTVEFEFSRSNKEEIKESVTYTYEIRSTTNNNDPNLDNRDMKLFENQIGQFTLDKSQNMAKVSLHLLSPSALQNGNGPYPAMFGYIRNRPFLLKIFKNNELVADRLLKVDSSDSLSSVPTIAGYAQGTSASYSFKLQFYYNPVRLKSIKVDNYEAEETCQLCYESYVKMTSDLNNSTFLKFDSERGQVTRSVTEGSTIMLKGKIEPDFDVVALNQEGIIFSQSLINGQSPTFNLFDSIEKIEIDRTKNEFTITRKLKTGLSSAYKISEDMGVHVFSPYCPVTDVNCPSQTGNMDHALIFKQKVKLTFVSSIPDPNLGVLNPTGWPAQNFVFTKQPGETTRITREFQITGIERYAELNCGFSDCSIELFNESTGAYSSLTGTRYSLPVELNSVKLRISFYNPGNTQSNFLSISSKNPGSPSGANSVVYFYRVE